MIAQHLIQKSHVLEMIDAIASSYEGGISNPGFSQDYGVSCKTSSDYLSFLESLTDRKDIATHIVEYVVGFGKFSIPDFREGDQVLYVYDGRLEVEVTEEYQDAYFRYFEDVE